MLPRSGDVVHVTKVASVQFVAPMLFRVIRVHDWPTYEGWVWLDGYELNAVGDAVERRSIFVQAGGLRAVGKAPNSSPRAGKVYRTAPTPAGPSDTNRAGSLSPAAQVRSAIAHKEAR